MANKAQLPDELSLIYVNKVLKGQILLLAYKALYRILVRQVKKVYEDISKQHSVKGFI